MPVQLNPDIDPVIITVVTNYNGVGATEVSASINEIIEEEIGSVEGVKKISSTAMEGTSIVTVEFGYDKDVDIAGVEVQNIISKIRNKLPDNIEEPEIRKFSSSDKPIITLSISGDYDLTFLRTLADNELKNNFQLIKGVASVNAIGGKKREIYVSVSQDKLETHNIPLSFVLTRINGQNINIPGGKISENSEDLLIRSIGKFENISDINNVVLYSDNNEKIIYYYKENQDFLFDTLDAICKQEQENSTFWKDLFYYSKDEFKTKKTRLFFTHKDTNLLKRCLFYFADFRNFSACLQTKFRAPQIG